MKKYCFLLFFLLQFNKSLFSQCNLRDISNILEDLNKIENYKNGFDFEYFLDQIARFNRFSKDLNMYSVIKKSNFEIYSKLIFNKNGQADSLIEPVYNTYYNFIYDKKGNLTKINTFQNSYLEEFNFYYTNNKLKIVKVNTNQYTLTFDISRVSNYTLYKVCPIYTDSSETENRYEYRVYNTLLGKNRVITIKNEANDLVEEKHFFEGKLLKRKLNYKNIFFSCLTENEFTQDEYVITEKKSSKYELRYNKLGNEFFSKSILNKNSNIEIQFINQTENRKILDELTTPTTFTILNKYKTNNLVDIELIFKDKGYEYYLKNGLDETIKNKELHISSFVSYEYKFK